MHYPPPPPYPPARRPRSIGRKIGMFGCLPVAVLFGALIGLGAIVGDDTDNADSSSGKSTGTVKPAASSAAPPKTAEPTTSGEPAPAETTTPGLSKRDITKMSVNAVWDSYSNARRDLLCIGVEVNGPGWFADQLTSDSLDREYAGRLVEEKCANR